MKRTGDKEFTKAMGWLPLNVAAPMMTIAHEAQRARGSETALLDVLRLVLGIAADPGYTDEDRGASLRLAIPGIRDAIEGATKGEP